jgi:hypothetical protein
MDENRRQIAESKRKSEAQIFAGGVEGQKNLKTVTRRKESGRVSKQGVNSFTTLHSSPIRWSMVRMRRKRVDTKTSGAKLSGEYPYWEVGEN